MSEPTSNLGGMGAILADLLKDLQNLVRGEIALARAEVRDDLATAGKGVASLVIALIFGLTGFIFVMLAATYVLNLWVRMWIAAGIVGAALVFFGAHFCHERQEAIERDQS